MNLRCQNLAIFAGLFCLLLPFTAPAQGFTWAGTPAYIGMSDCKSVKVDDSGNVYVAGYYDGQIDVDFGTGVTFFTSVGGKDIFVCKYDANGGLVWGKSIGGQYDDLGNALCLDGNGDVYVTGGFIGPVDFDPGVAVYNLGQNSQAAFVLKLTSNGNFAWAKAVERTAGYGLFGYGIAVDASGNVLITGTFSGSMDFDPGAGVYSLSSVSPNTDSAFLLKLNSSGNFVWANSTGGQDFAYVTGMALDASDNAYVTGDFTSSQDFDPGAGVFTLAPSPSTRTVFIWKINSGGTFGWAKAFFGPDGTNSGAIALDPSGNVLTSGHFLGSPDFDPGPGTYTLTGSGVGGYISKLDVNGDFVWAKQFDGNCNGMGITTDAAGNIYTTGGFSSLTDFDPGTGVYNLQISGFYGDAFISKLDASGNFGWVDAATGLLDKAGKSVAVDGSGNVVVAGAFKDYADFDPCIGDFELVSPSSDFDGFVWKLGGCTPSTATFTQSACNQFIVNGDTFVSSGIYVQTMQNARCCDSTITWNLTITTVNVAVTQSFDTLTADLQGASYQWLDCNQGNAPIPGATQRIFIASAVGDYAVVVTENGCSDTSLCYNVSAAGTVDATDLQLLQVFPNPTDGKVSFALPHPNEQAEVRLMDAAGHMLRQQSQRCIGNCDIDLQGLPAGVYLLQLSQRETLLQSVVLKTSEH